MLFVLNHSFRFVFSTQFKVIRSSEFFGNGCMGVYRLPLHSINYLWADYMAFVSCHYFWEFALVKILRPHVGYTSFHHSELKNNLLLYTYCIAWIRITWNFFFVLLSRAERDQQWMSMLLRDLMQWN